MDFNDRHYVKIMRQLLLIPWKVFMLFVAIFLWIIRESYLNIEKRFSFWFYGLFVRITETFIGKFVVYCCLLIINLIFYIKHHIDKMRKKTPKGLKNNRNNCYMNAILQNLSWCPKLKNELDQVELNESCKMTHLVRKLLKYVHSGDSQYCYNPSDFFAEAKKRNKDLKENEQEDSFEMFNTIVNAIKDEMVKLHQEKTSGRKVQTVEVTVEETAEKDVEETAEINDEETAEKETFEETMMRKCTGARLFFGTFITVCKYSSCTHIECEFERFSSIPVSIIEENDEMNKMKESKENDAKIGRCFDTRGSNRPMTDIERGIVHGLMKTEIESEEIVSCRKCERHETKGVSYSKTLLYEAPFTLVLQISRFKPSENKGQVEKRNDSVTFPETLNIDSFCSVICKVSKNVRYNLFGIVAHSGSIHSGHYTAFIRTSYRSSADWYDTLCNNSTWEEPDKNKDTVERTLEEREEEHQDMQGDIQDKSNDELIQQPETKSRNEETEWYQIDDAHVTLCTQKSVMQNKKAYLLLYEQI